jgi:hypothetical protein
MPYPRSQEPGLGARGIFLLLVVLLLVGLFFWIDPLNREPGELRLVAFAPGGAWGDTVALPAAYALGDAVRVPLVLGVHNIGARPAAPHALRLGVPGHVRLVDGDGQVLPSSPVPGSPLVQYVLEARMPEQEPGAPPVAVPLPDTIWIESRIRDYDCAIAGDGVPEFIPAPDYDPALLADVQIFYSVDTGTAEHRHSGILRLRLDPEQLRRAAVEAPVQQRLQSFSFEAPRPDLGLLARAGTRDGVCGDPSFPIELHTVVWRGSEGGLMYEVQYRGRPRKIVYDLDEDGYADLEIWDAAGDGIFRSRREVRFPIPSFLRPLPPAPPRRLRLAEDTLIRADSAWLALFNASGAGPLRFAEARRRAEMHPESVLALPRPETPPEEPRPRPPPRLLGTPVDTTRR